MPKYVIRCGVMKTLGVFTTSQGEVLRRGTRVVARTERGMEAGEVLCEATDEAVAQMQEPRKGHVMRVMSADDQRDLDHLHAKEREEYTVCETKIRELALDMQLVDVEHVFGGERIVFEGRDGSDQRDDEEREEERVLGRVEDVGERDLEDRVEAVRGHD